MHVCVPACVRACVCVNVCVCVHVYGPHALSGECEFLDHEASGGSFFGIVCACMCVCACVCMASKAA